MKFYKIINRTREKYWLLIIGCFIISLILNWLVFDKTIANFPVIFRSNEFGINFLGHRNLIWVIPALGMIFISINFWLSELLKTKDKDLSWLLFFANMSIAVLILLISIQIYILNR
ncbi:MAG: hypothetical protein PHG13_02085 [Candidatus Pacebacteria bacterium]|jgi:hypothetical protein|nr:hypothetical protein [Candidatus Paceibacterota bacterium]MDD5721770.1 hypothetical protein [Candidatus Paceibacterota bacterium]